MVPRYSRIIVHHNGWGNVWLDVLLAGVDAVLQEMSATALAVKKVHTIMRQHCRHIEKKAASFFQ